MTNGTKIAAAAAACVLVGVTTLSLAGRPSTAIGPKAASDSLPVAAPVMTPAIGGQPSNMPPRRVPIELTGG